MHHQVSIRPPLPIPSAYPDIPGFKPAFEKFLNIAILLFFHHPHQCPRHTSLSSPPLVSGDPSLEDVNGEASDVRSKNWETEIRMDSRWFFLISKKPKELLG